MSVKQPPLIFLSYSRVNTEVMHQIKGDLEAHGWSVWIDKGLRVGSENWKQAIDEAIRQAKCLVVILSPDAKKSKWVMTEIRRTRRREQEEKRRKLFPIRLADFNAIRDWTCFDANTGKDLAVEVREYFIPDFSNWKDPDSYKQAFDHLLAT